MNVAAADAAGANAHDDFIVGGLGVGKVDEFQFGRGGEEEGFHAWDAGRQTNVANRAAASVHFAESVQPHRKRDLCP
jgi:hypothetical protein